MLEGVITGPVLESAAGQVRVLERVVCALATQGARVAV
jgi:hypothetical protein